MGVWTSHGPEQTVGALAIDPKDPKILYAATAHGLFKSTDGTASWKLMKTGFEDSWVSSLEIDPKTPRTMYARTAFSGVFKTTDGGTRWTAMSEGIAGIFVATVAVDPATPQTVYAGTGGPMVTPVGGGVHKSEDGAGGWRNLGLEGDKVSVQVLLIDPSKPTTIYAGTGSGIYKTEDAGDGWSLIEGDLKGKFVHALAIDPATPKTLYAGTTNAGGIYKSTDGGQA
jgi:photosystem II stability/assembly factor-like uncharacterized protein